MWTKAIPVVAAAASLGFMIAAKYLPAGLGALALLLGGLGLAASVYSLSARLFGCLMALYMFSFIPSCSGDHRNPLDMYFRN